jgi:hypothetical protein
MIFFALFYFLWDKLSPTIKLIGILVFSLNFGSYTYTFLINPGIAKAKNNNIGKLEEGYRYCSQCRWLFHIDSNTTHCDECNVCVEGILNINSHRL